MNIFVTDVDPKVAARNLCNKHIPKMLLESCQLLCSAHVVAPYKRTHYNHPCSLWTRASSSNYLWLVEHALEISSEFVKRFGKVHKSHNVVQWCKQNVPSLPNAGLTKFAIAISDQRWHNQDPVIAYRCYYIAEKSRFAKWAPRSSPPSWWPFSEIS